MTSLPDREELLKITEECRKVREAEREEKSGEMMKKAYDKFVNICVENSSAEKIKEAAMKEHTRIRIHHFDLYTRPFPEFPITYRSILHGTHLTEIEGALKNWWTREYAASDFSPVLEQVRKNIGLEPESGFDIRCYKTNTHTWAVELDWGVGVRHLEWIENNNRKFGMPW